MSSVRRTADDAEYTLTWVVSEPGGVAGIESASFQRDELGTTRGDGIASAKGCFTDPSPGLPVPSTLPVWFWYNQSS